VLLSAKGIHGQGGPAATGGAEQHAVARGIVDIPFLVGAPDVPFHEVIEVVVGEGAGGAAERAEVHVSLP
jgi:hypothetical protein